MSARAAVWDALAAAVTYPADEGPDAQRAYVDAFDFDPDCSLEVGWHLVGDGPDRGVFLSFMREALARAGVPETGELPDHLAHVLTLIGREPEEDAADLARLVAPAVARVADALGRRHHPYADLLQTVHRLLATVSPREEVRP